jgi:hypothetical protein
LRFFEVRFYAWITNSACECGQEIQGILIESGQDAVGYAELVQEDQVMGFGEFYTSLYQQGLEVLLGSLLCMVTT